MSRRITSIAFVLVLCVWALAGPLVGRPAAQSASTDPHGYFKTLTARSDHWKSYSLRSQAELDANKKGTGAAAVFYDPGMEAAKVVIAAGTNSIPIAAQIILPMQTQTGHSTFITWDAYYTSSMAFSNTGIATHKTFNFLRDGRNIWWEVRNRWSLTGGSGISMLDFRSYLPGVAPVPAVSGSDLYPRANTWTRYWALFEQPVDGKAVVSMWAADEQQNPRLVIDRFGLGLPYSSIEFFELEFNTSTSTILAGRGDLVSYVRNVVMLRDVSNPAALLQRPFASGSLPAPPTNLRIVGP